MGRITAIARLPTPVTHLTAPTAAATLHLTATATPDLTAPTAAATLHLTATATPHRTVITDHPATTGGLLGFSTEGRRVGLGHLRLPTNSARTTSPGDRHDALDPPSHARRAKPRPVACMTAGRGASRSARCLKRKPRLLRRRGLSWISMRPLKSPVSPKCQSYPQKELPSAAALRPLSAGRPGPSTYLPFFIWFTRASPRRGPPCRRAAVPSSLHCPVVFWVPVHCRLPSAGHVKMTLLVQPTIALPWIP